MGRIANTKTFVDECIAEMGKVTWPDRDQLRNATMVVIVFTIILTLVIWIMDLFSSLVIVDFIMGMFRN
ncbi:MAG: preprotein translocase subunit SecE [Gemmatimonadota bacterium]|nr:preprotein translocase subunit SecE [Gemmatimonadota bacterium]